MIKKLLACVVLLIAVAVIGLAMNQSFMNKIYHDRYMSHLNLKVENESSLYYRIFINSDRWKFGDLFGLCYVSKFKLHLEPFKKYQQNPNRKYSNRVLYIIGDSYLADKELNGAFPDFDQVLYFDRRFPFGPILPDPKKNNFLILELAERNLNGYALNSTGEYFGNNNQQLPSNPGQKSTIVSLIEGLALRINKIIFNKDIDRNLSAVMFDNSAFTGIRELKANLNYGLFGRVVKEVSVSTNKDRLFLNSTVDTSYTTSSFKFKSNQDVKLIADSLELAEKHYITIGFNHVFIGLIPNTVSIKDSERMKYNRLLERVEHAVNIPKISVWDSFSKSRTNLFYKSDAHWNPSGLDLWIKEANKVIKQYE